ncbi:MAG: hypothetical protein K0R93_3648 [Anaerosolibacter sp.]|jgi:hypothetical protein|nr:hypothetical protein [Anaerosolibacter sp.]
MFIIVRAVRLGITSRNQIKLNLNGLEMGKNFKNVKLIFNIEQEKLNLWRK